VKDVTKTYLKAVFETDRELSMATTDAKKQVVKNK